MNKVVVTYPGVKEAEEERARAQREKKIGLEESDFVGGKPNYDKFNDWDIESVLAWLNID